jgi:UDP-N-acetylmuramate--alanine ligase
MSFEGIHNAYFLGIGGIGMSALARWFNHEGMTVSGYDRTSSPLTDQLIAEGMTVNFVDELDVIPESIKSNPTQSMIIWTPAIPADSAQLNYFRDQGFQLKKRSEILGMVTSTFYTIAVAGTHGKTTTSSLLAHLLKAAGKPVAAFLGGITQNYQSNLILGDKNSKEPTLVVVEADEFDRSFLRLHPNEAIVTSADPDHLDIYGDESSILQGFSEFLKLIDKKGKLYIQQNAALKLEDVGMPKVKTKTYGLGSATISAQNIQAKRGSFIFDYVTEKQTIRQLEIFVPGFHNVENAIGAIAVALDHQLTEDQIRKGLASFKGVKRRFEIHLNTEHMVFIDDYAHHPEEIRASLSSVRAMFPMKKITVIFQPHLFTRTRDFAAGFSESLSLADEVILLDIYPARELPIPGVESAMLLNDISATKKSLVKKEELFNYLETTSLEVLVTLGAGDIDRLVPALAEWSRERAKRLAL